MSHSFIRRLIVSSLVVVCPLSSHALAQSDTVVAWGSNFYGQCTTPSDALSGVTSIACGGDHTIALKNGAVLAWGSNSYGQCAIPSSAAFGVTAIAGGYAHTIAHKAGAVLAWGNNSNGQCNIPLSAYSGVTAIAGGYAHTIALKDGAVLAWGSNYSGQCNIPSDALNGVTAIASGSDHTIALRDGTVLAWGHNAYGQCDIPLEAQSGVTSIAGGGFHTIALKDGGVLAWGYNSSGQCNVPASVKEGVTAIAGGSDHTLALKNGAVLAWGENWAGQCTVPSSAQSRVVSIAGGGLFSASLVQSDACDVDNDRIPNSEDEGSPYSQWIGPSTLSNFENPENWSEGVPGIGTYAFIFGDADIDFLCDNAVQSLTLGTASENPNQGMSFTFHDTSLRVYNGAMRFDPGDDDPSGYEININQNSGADCTILSGSPNEPLPLQIASNPAQWNFFRTHIESPSIELELIGQNPWSSWMWLDFNDCTLSTTSFTTKNYVGGSNFISLTNTLISNPTETEPLVFGPHISVALGGGEFESSTIYSTHMGTIFQPNSRLGAAGNIYFSGNVSIGGGIFVTTVTSEEQGRTNLTVRDADLFEFCAGESANPYAVMDLSVQCLDNPAGCQGVTSDPLINLSLKENGLARIGGPLSIYNRDNSIPSEGSAYSLISLGASGSGSFDPFNNNFSIVRYSNDQGEGLPNGLTFEQVVSDEGLQLVCVRAPIVEPAPTSQTVLPSVPFASSSADFTNDGLDDVVNLILGSVHSVQIMKDLGDGSFSQLRAFNLPVGHTPNAIAAGDVIGDGAPEIVITSVPENQPYSGTISLFTATGEPIWVRQLDYNMFPTCTCVVAPSANDGPLGRVVVGIEKFTEIIPESAFANSQGGVMGVSGDNSDSQYTPVNSVPRTVRGCDIDDDEFSDVTAAGSTSATSVNPDPQGFLQVVKMTANGSFALEPLMLDYVPVSIANADIDGDGVQDIFAANNSIPSNFPISTWPVASLMRGSINPASGQFSLSAPTGISVGQPVQGKAISVVKREGGFSLAVASTDGADDTVDVLELNAFANGGISIGNQQAISTGGNVVGLHTLGNRVSNVDKFATVRQVPSINGTSALIESTGYIVRLFGDLDGNGVLDTGDISMILLSYGEPGATDLDGSGVTDSGDVSLLLLLFE